MNRYVVRPIDNDGTLDPPPPRDRTWAVYDRELKQYLGDHYTRRGAREEAVTLNAEETHDGG